MASVTSVIETKMRRNDCSGSAEQRVHEDRRGGRAAPGESEERTEVPRRGEAGEVQAGYRRLKVQKTSQELESFGFM